MYDNSVEATCWHRGRKIKPTLPMYAAFLPKPFFSLSSDIVCFCCLCHENDRSNSMVKTRHDKEPHGGSEHA